MAYSKEIKALLDQGAQDMAAKQYEHAVEHYSEACELSNLETGVDDPDLLYLYGWALYENAVANSDVLGQTAAKQSLADAKEAVDAEDAEEDDGEGKKGGMMQFSEKLAEGEEIEQLEEEEEEIEKEIEGTKEETEGTKAEIGGTKEADGTKAEADGTADPPVSELPEEEAPQTDFEVAWDILDLTRSLLEKKVAELDTEEGISEGDEKAGQFGEALKKKLSDVFSLLGDISLENENFGQAAQDLGSMVKLRKQLYPEASGALTEAFYRLSLALEFTDLPASIDAMKTAIKSLDAREKDGEKIDPDIKQEMSQRLYDLEKGDAEVKAQKDQIMKGILGTATGATGTAATSAPVNDLSGMVHTKKRKAKSVESSGKKAKK